jgi:hypothetical protein
LAAKATIDVGRFGGAFQHLLFQIIRRLHFFDPCRVDEHMTCRAGAGAGASAFRNDALDTCLTAPSMALAPTATLVSRRMSSGWMYLIRGIICLTIGEPLEYLTRRDASLITLDVNLSERKARLAPFNHRDCLKRFDVFVKRFKCRLRDEFSDGRVFYGEVTRKREKVVCAVL